MERILILYFIVINLAGMFLMRSDKQRAIKKQWRISEQTLFLVSLAGGCIGTWAGMYLFRHKTKHWYFVVGMPLILVIQIVFVVKLLLFSQGIW